jgi:RNA polymerase sigma factor (sigma-70 family)
MEAQSLPRTGRLFLPRNPRVLAAFTDERLVDQVRRGNETAFEAIYDRHHRGILSFCRHMLSSVEEAEDAVQQTFISAYGSLRADGREIRLKPWLYTIARNRCLSTLRSRHERPAELEDVPTAGLAEEVEQRSDLRQLLEDMRGLPVDQRAALVLSEIGDLSHAEVGAVVGCEVPKVKSLVFQARSSLIESRNARETPCQQIREQLSTATGGALRRGPLRRHLKACEGCAEFAEQVKHQRRALALILPVAPTLALKKSALASLFTGGGGAGGAAAGGGGIASVAGSSIAAKAVTMAAIAGVAVGGGLLIDEHSSSRIADAAGGQNHAAVPAGPVASSAGGPGVGARTISNRTRSQPAARGPVSHAKAQGNGGGGSGGGAHARSRQGAGGPHASGGHRSGRHRGAPSKGGSDRGGRHPSGGSNPSSGSNPSGGSNNGAPGASATPVATTTPGNDDSRGGGRHNGNRGHHGHDQHSQDVGGVHTPGGHATTPAPAPPAAPDEGDDHHGSNDSGGGKGHGGKGDGGGDNRGDDGHERLIALLPTPPTPPAS